jgi:CO/xanthine dehydrogenase FAD-binding subunit
VSGAGSIPCRVREVEALVEGSAAGAALFDEAGRLASRILEGYDDVRASAQYRKVALGQLVRKVLTRAAERAGCEVR